MEVTLVANTTDVLKRRQGRHKFPNRGGNSMLSKYVRRIEWANMGELHHPPTACPARFSWRSAL